MSCRVLLVMLLGTGGLTSPARLVAAEPTLRLGDTRFRAGGPVADLLFSADGGELTSRVPIDASDTRVTVWDAATGLPLRMFTEPRRPGTRSRWGATTIPDTTRGVVIDADGVAVVRDFEANKDLVRLTGHFARITAVTVAPDGKRLATASADGLIRVWDTATFRPLVESRGHTGAVRGVDVSPDGRLVLTTGADRTVRLWDLATGRELRAFPAAGEANAAFTPDGAAVRVPVGEQVVVRDLVTGLEMVSPVPRRADPFAGAAWLLRQAGVCAAVSPDGRTVAVGTGSGVIELYEAATGQVRRRLAGPGGACLDVAFTPDGSKLLTAGADHSVLVWPVRLRDYPLTAELKRETSAVKLWDRLATADAATAYAAMARLAADPPAAVKMARLRLTPGESGGTVAATRAAELLDAIGTTESRAFLRELMSDPRDTPGDIRTTGGSNP